jgi:hypothetical protein
MVMSFSIFFTFARDAARRAHVKAPDDGLRNGACGRAAAGETLRNGAYYVVASFLAREQLYTGLRSSS